LALRDEKYISIDSVKQREGRRIEIPLSGIRRRLGVLRSVGRGVAWRAPIRSDAREDAHQLVIPC